MDDTNTPAVTAPAPAPKPKRKRKASKKRKRKAAPAPAATSSAPAIVGYLAGLGVDVDPESLQPPTVDALFRASSRPTQWIDRDGNPVPPSVGELYRIDAAVGDSQTQRTIRAKEREGFRLVPREAGLRWQSVSEEDMNHIAMIRTPEAKKVHEDAEELKRTSKLGKRRTQPHLAGGGAAVIETNRTEVGIPLRK